jgi:hypothetical protein
VEGDGIEQKGRGRETETKEASSVSVYFLHISLCDIASHSRTPIKCTRVTRPDNVFPNTMGFVSSPIISHHLSSLSRSLDLSPPHQISMYVQPYQINLVAM